MSSRNQDKKTKGRGVGAEPPKAKNKFEEYKDILERHWAAFFAALLFTVPTCALVFRYIYKERLDAKTDKIQELERQVDQSNSALKECVSQLEKDRRKPIGDGPVVNGPTPTPTPTPAPTPSIRITVVPPVDPGGSKSSVHIEGSVSGLNGYRVVLYSYTNRWYVEPYIDAPFTGVNPDGGWSTDIGGGSKYAALLVKPGFVPPPTASNIPGGLGDDVVAFHVVNGAKSR
jgi:hypothetical protein